ncbi:MAG: hypothetical protein U0797_06905 [Gemmataceae bacterium]
MNTLHAILPVGIAWLALGLPARAEAPRKKTALDDYVAKADSTYAWKLVKTSQATASLPSCSTSNRRPGAPNWRSADLATRLVIVNPTR